jgi:N-acetylmuramoyl-L-alanine amidase
LLDPHSVPGHKIAKITLDAGHGGNDTGALGKRSKEKVLTLKITQRTAAILRACGYKVYLTRSSDKEVPLKTRAQLQRQHKSDLFVSIHINAAANRSVSGIETFALTSADAPSSMGKAEKISNPANIRDGNNVLLAYHLQKALIGRTKAVDRGVKRARFVVLKDISAPGALVELGFISNAAEEGKLNQKDYVEKLARAIAEGIIAYHRSLKR